jgi:uncharacterized protein with PQ loop repeat
MAESAIAAILGGSASVLFVASHVPQVVRLVRGPAEGVSAGMFTVQLVSGVLWVAYGLLQRATSILVFGALSTAMRLLILGLLAARRGEAAAAAQQK